jgi:predicted enzyme related to lactoylglutathione lyase
MHGQFVWYELISPDPDGAKKFYSPITGWGTQAFDKDYTMWTTGGAPFAGLYRLSPEMRQQGIPPHWMPYVEANNVDETVRLASSLGGKAFVGPQDIPNVGRFALIQDPQGARFGVYKASGPSRSWDGTPTLGRMSWHELMTTDSQKAFEFYRKLFGWDKTSEMDMGGGNMYRMFGKGQPFGGMFNRPPEMANMPPFWLPYIFVKDTKKAVDAASKSGAFIQRPPMEVPGGGTIAIIGDPQGAAIAFHSATATAARPAAKKASTARKASTAKKASTSKKRAVAKKRGGTKKRATTKKRAKASKRRSAAKKAPAAKKRPATKKSARRRR